MKVFISWSGTLGGQVAEKLRAWLPLVVQSVDPYLSSEDTHKGTRWREVVGKELESSNYGIICVTPENVDSRWMNFEAGALSKELEGSRVSPFLIRLKPTDLEGSPLSQFQMTVHHEYQDVLKLIKSINAVAERKLSPDLLENVFHTWWPRLKDPLDELLKEYDAKRSLPAGRNAEEKLEELLVLARGQEKILKDLSRASKSTTNASVSIMPNGTNLANIKYLLRHAREVADEAARAGNPESPAYVQVRGLIDVVQKELFGKSLGSPDIPSRCWRVGPARVRCL